MPDSSFTAAQLTNSTGTVTIDLTNGDPSSGLLRADAVRLEVPGWNDSNLGGYDGDSRWTTGGTASYTFTNAEVAPGETYQLYVNTPGHENSGTATYEVISGNATVAVFSVDQSTPTSQQAGNVDGWLPIGLPVNVVGTDLSIRVSGSSSGLLRADGIGIESLPDAPVFYPFDEGDLFTDIDGNQDPVFQSGQVLGELQASDPNGDEVFFSSETSAFFGVSPEGVVTISDPAALVAYFDVEDVATLPVYAFDGVFTVASQVVLSKGGLFQIDQSEISVTTRDGNTYYPSTAAELIDDLETIRDDGDMVDELIIKGHAGPEAIQVGDGEEDFMSVFNGNILIGAEDITDLLNDVTDEETDIDLRGCKSRQVADDLEGALDGAEVEGRRWFIIGIPGTRQTIGW